MADKDRCNYCTQRRGNWLAFPFALPFTLALVTFCLAFSLLHLGTKQPVGNITADYFKIVECSPNQRFPQTPVELSGLRFYANSQGLLCLFDVNGPLRVFPGSKFKIEPSGNAVCYGPTCAVDPTHVCLSENVFPAAPGDFLRHRFFFLNTKTMRGTAFPFHQRLSDSVLRRRLVCAMAYDTKRQRLLFVHHLGYCSNTVNKPNAGPPFAIAALNPLTGQVEVIETLDAYCSALAYDRKKDQLYAVIQSGSNSLRRGKFFVQRMDLSTSRKSNFVQSPIIEGPIFASPFPAPMQAVVVGGFLIIISEDRTTRKQEITVVRLVDGSVAYKTELRRMIRSEPQSEDQSKFKSKSKSEGFAPSLQFDRVRESTGFNVKAMRNHGIRFTAAIPWMDGTQGFTYDVSGPESVSVKARGFDRAVGSGGEARLLAITQGNSFGDYYGVIASVQGPRSFPPAELDFVELKKGKTTWQGLNCTEPFRRYPGLAEDCPRRKLYFADERGIHELDLETHDVTLAIKYTDIVRAVEKIVSDWCPKRVLAIACDSSKNSLFIAFSGPEIDGTLLSQVILFKCDLSRKNRELVPLTINENLVYRKSEDAHIQMVSKNGRLALLISPTWSWMGDSREIICIVDSATGDLLSVNEARPGPSRR